MSVASYEGPASRKEIGDQRFLSTIYEPRAANALTAPEQVRPVPAELTQMAGALATEAQAEGVSLANY